MHFNVVKLFQIAASITDIVSTILERKSQRRMMEETIKKEVEKALQNHKK